ncbi:MAG TPA: carboxypeptidase regulatory-like domain-containing protein, partial [Alphaproteobacteria bacterium]|nr:carboxypeptidase regulatory-like domain-containing protein [Alphaproteobacteria bacterium]
MRRSAVSLFLVFVFSLLHLTATAQEHKGSITGRVTDATQAVLQGARIEIEPNGPKAVSDSQGQFTIYGLTPGHYKMKVSYVGFTPFTADLDVSAGQVAHVNAALQVGPANEVVEVRVERQRGEEEALNRERTAENILQVLPSEVITSLPNTNIADAVGRLPSVSLERDEGEGKYVQIRGTEPRLSNVTINGMHVPSPEGVRNVKLDVIPADLVESVEISKTLSANQEADAIGGSVNLVTKMATERPYVSVMGMGGYTPIAGGRGLDQFNGAFGQRFGKAKRLGIMIGGSYDWNGRGIDDVEPAPTTQDFGSGPQAFTPTADLREYWYDRTRYGFAGTMDCKLGEMSSAYLKGLFSRFKDFGQNWIYSPQTGTMLSPTQPAPGANDGSMAFTQVFRVPEQRIFSVATGARHDVGSNLLNYELALGQARQTGGFPRAGFNGPTNVAFGVDTSDPFIPRFPVLNGVNIYDPSTYVLDSLQLGGGHTYERDVTGSFSLAHHYTLRSHFSIFEFGAKVRDARKTQIENQQIFG